MKKVRFHEWAEGLCALSLRRSRLSISGLPGPPRSLVLTEIPGSPATENDEIVGIRDHVCAEASIVRWEA